MGPGSLIRTKKEISMPTAATQFIVLGNIGSDAGYWVWDGTGWRHVGGWGLEQLVEVRAALSVACQSSQFKPPGLGQAIGKTVAEFAQKQLAQHLPEAGKGGTNTII